jgi:hypothetical protein
MTIYLANTLFYYKRDFISYDSISKLTLREYGFKDKTHFDTFSSKLFSKLKNRHNFTD